MAGWTMNDKALTKERLLVEMAGLRTRIAELESRQATAAQSVEALRKSEMRYRFISENVGDFIWQLDKDLRFTYVSPSVKRLNLKPEEMEGKSILSFLTLEGIKITKELYARRQALMKSGVVDDTTMVELQFVCKDGSLLPVEARISPYFDAKGNLMCFQGVTRDISQRKRAEEALRESEEKF